MNILLVTDDGASLGLADRLNSEGNSVQVLARKSIGPMESRLFTYQDNLQKGLTEAKLVLCDIDGWQHLDQRAKYTNRPVIGSHHLASMPNRDFFKQFSLFKRFELPTPVTEQFDDLTEALKTAVSWEANRTVIRYGTTEFRCDYKDWLAWAMLRIPVGQRILFQQLAFGQEVVLTGWFDGWDFADAFSIAPSINFQLSKFAAVAPVNEDKPIVKDTIVKLTPYLRQCEYHGPVHLELVLTDKSFVVQKMHVGFMFPLDYTLLEFIQGDISKFLNGIAFPNGIKMPKTKDFVGVVQAQCVGSELQGAPILGLNPERLKHLVFHNATVDLTDGSYQLGHPPIKDIFTAFAHGSTIAQVCDRVYQTVESVKFPEKHYNGNLAAVVSPMFEKLKTWGYV